jgi:hypothetical protein
MPIYLSINKNSGQNKKELMEEYNERQRHEITNKHHLYTNNKPYLLPKT